MIAKSVDLTDAGIAILLNLGKKPLPTPQPAPPTPVPTPPPMG